MPMHFFRTARNEQGIDCEVRWSDKTGVVEVCLFEYRPQVIHRVGDGSR